MSKAKISSGQRALWTFLMAALVGPFLAAVVVLMLGVGAGSLGFGPPSLRGKPIDQLLPTAAGQAMATFVWSIFPAALAGALSAAWLSWRGVLPWLAVAVFGAAAATVGAITAGGLARDHVTPVAFIAAVVAIGCWLILRRARIVTAE
jgi:hypothetical protein